MTVQLNRARADGLRRIRDGGPGAWAPGIKSRTGGQIARMFEMFVKEGLCTPAPYTITEKGRACLSAFDGAHCRHCGKIERQHRQNGVVFLCSNSGQRFERL